MFHGALWNNPSVSNPAAISLQYLLTPGSSGWLAVLLIGLAGVIAGLVVLKRQTGWAVPAIFGASLAGGGALIAVSYLKSHYLYHWYLTPVLGILLILVIVRLSGLLRCTRARLTRLKTRHTGLGAVFVLVLLVSYAQAVGPITTAMHTYPIEDLRTASALTRLPGSGLNRPGMETALLYRRARLYDPHAHTKFPEMNDFINLVSTCAKTHRPLHVAIGMVPMVRSQYPLLIQTLENEAIFERGPRLPGAEANYELQIFRLSQSPDLK